MFRKSIREIWRLKFPVNFIPVLMRKRFVRHASYVYLRSLAWADAAYLALTLQLCMNAEHFTNGEDHVHLHDHSR